MTEQHDIPTRDHWTLFSHYLSNAESYQTSYLRMCDVASFQDFGRMWNHTHPKLIGDASRIIQIQGRRVTSWSFFKNGISPEWEHPENASGITFSVRSTMSPDDAYALWETLVTNCVLSKHPDTLNGVQLSRKSTHVRPHEPGLFMKCDLWFSSDADCVAVTQWIRETLPSYAFTHVPRVTR